MDVDDFGVERKKKPLQKVAFVFQILLTQRITSYKILESL